ncbi:MAG: sigma-70 family RNA polymerase sigma factor [Bacteroidales bacterium]|nr:sigma-70 family RNA polymerase sigma factor [Bacteroidales bacterium]
MNTTTFQERLVKLQDNLLSFAFMLTSNKEDAYDLLQDTTLKALDNQDKYQPGTNFKGWVFTIMRNIFINHYRRMVRSVVVADQSDDLYLLNIARDDGDSSPEQTFAVKEITRVLRSFPDDYREPFTMLVAGYHYGEIAKKMHLPLGTIKSRIYYARQYLQKALADYNPTLRRRKR